MAERADPTPISLVARPSYLYTMMPRTVSIASYSAGRGARARSLTHLLSLLLNYPSRCRTPAPHVTTVPLVCA
jgi:hypothetical protein